MRLSLPTCPRINLPAFILLSWLHMLVQTWPYFHAGTATPAVPAQLFHWLAWPCYSLIYLLPALIVVAALAQLLPRAHKTIAAAAIVATVASLLFIQADRTLYDLYNFHFNGFVVNLLMTPGGVASLGGGADTYLSFALIIARVFAVQGVVFCIASRAEFAPRWERWCLATFVCALPR
ncbi:MAG: DUF3413 domain-containing protein [Spongiibacteraceae bacterium]